MPKRQVNVALSDEEYDVLVTLAFVEEVSASELLRPVVARFLEEQAKSAEVRLGLEALQARRAAKTGKLARIDENRRGGAGR